MRHIFVRAATVAVACILFKMALSIVIMPLLGAKLDPVNWFWFIISPAFVALPAAAYFFWTEHRAKRALAALKRAHRDLNRAHQRLGEEARRDSMTGLLNREGFFAAVEAARGESATGTLLFADADRFKRINDSFGHMTGDAALLEIAAAIRRSIREDDVAGRIGGEEFGIFLPGAIGPEAIRIAERIRRSVEGVQLEPAPGASLRLTVSIGGVSAGSLLTTAELMQIADKRLYQAKRSGRNRIALGRDAREKSQLAA